MTTGGDAGRAGAPVRSFVAIALDAPARAAVAAAAATLRHDLPFAVRWTPVDALHLTVRFLGELPATTVDALAPAIAARIAEHRAFDLRLRGAGAFPPRGRPRVVWIGVEATPALRALYAAVEAACGAVGLAHEPRPFHPHVTADRVAPGVARPGAVAEGPPAVDPFSRVGFVATYPVASLHLMRSELTPAGARHTPIATLPLAAHAGARGASAAAGR